MKTSPTGLADILQFTNGSSSSDEELRAAVLNSLSKHPGVPRNCLEVVVEQGRVSLSGTVTRPYERGLAEAQAKSVAGVEEVFNGIAVEGER